MPARAGCRSLGFLQGFGIFPGIGDKSFDVLECRSMGRDGEFVTSAKL